MMVRSSIHGAPKQRRRPGILFRMSGALLALTLFSCEPDDEDPEKDSAGDSNKDKPDSKDPGKDSGDKPDDKDESKTPEDESETPEDESKTPEDESETPEDESKTPEDDPETPEDESKSPEDESKTPEDESKDPKPKGRDCDKIEWGPREITVGNIIARGDTPGYLDTDKDHKPEEKETTAGMCELHLTGKKCGLINYGAG